MKILQNHLRFRDNNCLKGYTRLKGVIALIIKLDILFCRSM